MPQIELCDFDGLGLIIALPTGVTYTNQVAGFRCLHPELEGAFAPLPDGVGRPTFHALQQHFRGSWHPITAIDADVVDRILHRADLGFMTTNRGKLGNSYEAWIHVEIRALPVEVSPLLSCFGSQTGVLTWPNSD